MARPEIFVIAGPNGAGKSTVASAILPARLPAHAFLNADDIAQALGTNSPITAGRVMLQRMRHASANRETFAFETTLAARSYVPFLRRAQRDGYWVHLTYIWLSSVELAGKRVAVRVQRGGHDIPAADIERRYWRGLRNFFAVYRELANAWVLCDNSGARLVIVARGRQGAEPTVYDQRRYDRIGDASRTNR